MPDLEQVLARIKTLTPEAKSDLDRETQERLGPGRWLPTPGPQTEAYFSPADLLLYGGQAGGGKTDLLLGLALNEHHRSLIVRRRYPDMTALIARALEIHGTKTGYSGSTPPSLKTRDDRLIEFFACIHAGDEEKMQGNPHDFVGFEEGAQLLKTQVNYLQGWIRSVNAKQRKRCVIASNPPLTAEGQWMFEMFGAWLNPAHPNPARPGELRWFITNDIGEDTEVEGPEPVLVGERMVQPKSRTFIPASTSDNPYLSATGYQATLDAMPEPLRSAMRDGSFLAGRNDDLKQLIPSAWVFEARNRWTEKPPLHAPMCAMGVDVAQGGTAKTVIACRYDAWFAPLISVPGKETPQGSDVAALVVKHRRNNAIPIIDMGGGYGGGTKEHLEANNIKCIGYNGSITSAARTKDRSLAFFNKRAEAHWRFREALDPDQQGGSPIALPPDPELIADLVAPHFEVTARGILVEEKKAISDRLGRSPDKGDATIMAWSDGAITATHGQQWSTALKNQQRPQVHRGHSAKRRK